MSHAPDNKPGSIAFTHHMRPHGQIERLWFDLASPAALKKAKQIQAAGFRFEIEILFNGIVRATVSDEMGDYAIVTYPNGPGLEVAINDMILAFNIDSARARRNAAG